ncbi:hypothetical protein BGZ97_000020 [Linnemannia gamsii]|uniref:Aspartate aminotransferase n=1 Tax=Linnemannia gamsii TaxID=64522 RepID=A0A9P6RRF9_9FUNG|nr:hypothetical protein BGZ97_000020 [Linnemannia gamsii]
MTLFATVELAPRDPILGLNETFSADTRPTKVNLGIGVYTNDEGRLPLLRAVREAEKARIEAAIPRGYLPIDGIAAYDAAVQKLLFGNASPLIAQGRIVTAQSLGGTGALKIGADFLKRLKPNAKVAVSNPSWENHRAIFQAAGFEVLSYPYYNAETQNVDFASLSFGAGIEEDAAAIRLFAEAGINSFVANSFSKSFSLYGERVGALSVITSSQDEAKRVLSQLKQVIRCSYSNPPTHGAALVAAILSSPELRTLWEEELSEMRGRILSMRSSLITRLKQYGAKRDFNFISRQRGMFSYSGLNAQQVERLKAEFGIYAVSSGRICVAALNTKNVEVVAQAIAHVLDTTV